MNRRSHTQSSISSSELALRSPQKHTRTEENTAAEKALKWTREFDGKKQIYPLVLGPIFDLLRLLGRFPFYRDQATGEMRFTYCSGIMLYSVLLYMLFSVTTVFSVVELYNEPMELFGDHISAMLTISMIAPQLISPVISWIAMKSLQEYVNKWVVFQDFFEYVTYSNFPTLLELRPCKLTILTQFVLPTVISTIILPYYLSEYLDWHHYPSFLFNTMGNIAFFWYWMRTMNVISAVAMKFHHHFLEEIRKSRGYTSKIEEYRLLWMKLSELIRGCGSCNMFIVSIFTLTSLCYLVVILQRLLFKLPKYLNAHDYNAVVINIIVTCFWWFILQLYCNAGYQAAEDCMNNIVENFIHLEKVKSQTSELYSNIFLFSLRKYQPKAMISGYYVVNHGLMGNMVKSLITYIILVEQLESSGDALMDYSQASTNTSLSE